MAKSRMERCSFQAYEVLKKEVIKPGGTSNVASKLGTAKTSNFLFLPSQTINKRLLHLCFQDIKTYPENSGFNFSTPYDHRYKKRLKPVEQSVILEAVTIEPQVIAPPTKTITERPVISEAVIIEPQVIAPPTMTDAKGKTIQAKKSGRDLTVCCNNSKKVKNLMNWYDKFH
ncbi:hypothetical protein C1646_812539 [Rhizophagus diaphanus]|nr:hypothetical protein C1646_812539 [Rhizophagus diaphanus] [Rhizophagus sp. MUCL 43196]